MILEVISAGLVISACLAIFLDEAVYSVVALTGTFLLTSLLYALGGAIFVSVFQFAVGVGTLAILFLSGEMLSEKPTKKTSPKNIATVAVLGALLALPPIFLSISGPNNSTSEVSFGEALWNLRAVDVVLQGL
ncbi:MAG TPA: NADH-quinone oxidoreductase subunit J, partial [Candidatus Bathyarchaeia archaeon]